MVTFWLARTVQLKRDGNPLSLEISLKVHYQLQLLLDRQPAHDRLQGSADGDVVFSDETAEVHIGENTHQEPRSYVSVRTALHLWAKKS